MSLMRSLLLAGSENRWLRQTAPKLWFVRRAVRRFMPGETIDDALTAAQAQQRLGVGTVFTLLGESLVDPAEADAVRQHYLDVLDRVQQIALDAEISVKPTQLGLDFSRETCEANLIALAERADALGNWVWVDMESTAYTDVTIDMYVKLRARFPRVGLCVQAYLFRTDDDLKRLIALGGSVRLVKGAYLEPPTLAYPAKRDVDEAYFRHAMLLVSPEARERGVRAIFGTHDPVLIRRITEAGTAAGVPKERLEFQMLYGIQRAEQQRLTAAGYPFRVLIAYGHAWFAWYMRRLAERPANVLFVMRSLIRS